jgi:hypothetical protein
MNDNAFTTLMSEKGYIFSATPLISIQCGNGRFKDLGRGLIFCVFHASLELVKMEASLLLFLEEGLYIVPNGSSAFFFGQKCEILVEKFGYQLLFSDQ